MRVIAQATLRKMAAMSMNTQFKFDHLESSNLRAHYEDVATSTLAAIGRHKWLIASFVIVALVASGLVIPLLPRMYVAEAFVHPDLFSRDDRTKLTPLASIDGATLVTGEARQIGSDAMVRAVVKRLELDRDFIAQTSKSSEIFDRLRAAFLPETHALSQLERSVASVRQRLTVTNDSRTYLISISFTAVSPEMAAKVANAFALEYLRPKTMQRLADAMTVASRELEQRSAIYGEKHPNVIRAQEELEAASERLQAALNAPEKAEGDIIALAEGVTLAEPNSTPTKS